MSNKSSAKLFHIDLFGIREEKYNFLISLGLRVYRIQFEDIMQ
jgi:hypothetical protein